MPPPGDSDSLALKDDLSLEQASKVSGNATLESKLATSMAFKMLNRGFGGSIGENLTLVEVSVNQKAGDRTKLEGHVVCEVIVVEEMLNPSKIIHGGATAWLVDTCSTLALVALGDHQGDNNLITVSQALNIMYHGPAKTGDKLQIISTTISIGGRVQTVSCEVWNITHHRLVATGTHAKMRPSVSKL